MASLHAGVQLPHEIENLQKRSNSLPRCALAKIRQRSHGPCNAENGAPSSYCSAS